MGVCDLNKYNGYIEVLINLSHFFLNTLHTMFSQVADIFFTQQAHILYLPGQISRVRVNLQVNRIAHPIPPPHFILLSHCIEFRVALALHINTILQDNLWKSDVEWFSSSDLQMGGAIPDWIELLYIQFWVQFLMGGDALRVLPHYGNWGSVMSVLGTWAEGGAQPPPGSCQVAPRGWPAGGWSGHLPVADQPCWAILPPPSAIKTIFLF